MLILGGNSIYDVYVSVILLVCILVPFFIPRRTKVYKRRTDKTKIRQKRLHDFTISQIFVILERRMPFLKSLRLWDEKLIEKRVRATGSPHDPEKMATNSTRISTALFFTTAIVGIVGFIIIDPLFLSILAVPLGSFFAPLLTMKIESIERKTRIEEELAYFLSYVNIMQSINTGLYQSFRLIRGTGVFPAFEKDVSEISKRVELLGMTQKESLDIYASNHPSTQFANFVKGYLAKITSVGNVPRYTESKAKYFFDEYLGAWDRYEKSAQEIFSAIIMIAVILPMMIAFNALLGSGSTASLLLLLGMILPPLVSIIMIIMLNASQPSTGNKYEISYISFMPGVVVGMLTFISGVSLPVSFGMACLITGISNYTIMKNASAKSEAIDTMLPEFMRDITEMSQTGQNINQIIQKQSIKKAYKKRFNNILLDIAKKIRTGMSFVNAVDSIKTHSKQVRFIFFLLARTYSTGGGSSDIFYNITDFITKIQQKKQQVRKGLASLTVIVFFTPFLMLGVSHMMLGMFTNSYDISEMGAVPFGSKFDDSILYNIELITIFTSVSMGVVAAKISNGTIKNTLPLSISSLTTILAIYMLPAIIEEFGI